MLADTVEDVKYGNVIVEVTKTPYFVDWERALPLRRFSRTTATYLRDRDADQLNQLFGTDLLTAKVLQSSRLPADTAIYSPFMRCGIGGGRFGIASRNSPLAPYPGRPPAGSTRRTNPRSWGEQRL